MVLLMTLNCKQPSEYQNDIQAFFDNLVSFNYVDSLQIKFNMNVKYLTLNQEKMCFQSNVPDSIIFAGFYNAYSKRIIDAFYERINSDTTITYESLFKANSCDAELVKEKVVSYCISDSVFSGVFNEALSAFNNSENTEKKPVLISIDSLINISMSYFGIAGYFEERGIGFHFGCGNAPYKSGYENRFGILISGFCKEAITNYEMSQAYSEIVGKLQARIKSEVQDLSDFPQIKIVYEPILYEMIKEEGTLKKSLLDYYELRKEIESFELTN